MNWWPTVFPSKSFLCALVENDHMRWNLIAICGSEEAGEAAWQEVKQLSYTTTLSIAEAYDRISTRILLEGIDVCDSCERCMWNPGADCGVADHPHCPTCGHCAYRHSRRRSR